MVLTMVRRSSRTQGTSDCLAAIPTARPHGPAPITSSSMDSVILR